MCRLRVLLVQHTQAFRLDLFKRQSCLHSIRKQLAQLAACPRGSGCLTRSLKLVHISDTYDNWRDNAFCRGNDRYSIAMNMALATTAELCLYHSSWPARPRARVS